MRQRRDQQLRRVCLGIAGAVEVEEAVGLAACHRREPVAQLGLAQCPVPHRIVIDEKAGSFVLGVADQQRGIVGERRR